MSTSKSPSQRRYPPELHERAVRIVREAIAENGERFGIVTRVARQLGIGPESLRNWVKQGRCSQSSSWFFSGRRDRAMLMLLRRLGLRVGELVGLDLSDIDWHHAEVTIRGKARSDERVPLPPGIDEALVEYILHGQDGGPRGPVFLADGLDRPWTTKGVRSALATVCRRAGIAPVGAHALRHTAAAEMLRAGASLMEVGQVLAPSNPVHHGHLHEGRQRASPDVGSAMAGPMTPLREAADSYVTLRRRMGFKFEEAAELLADFVRYQEEDGAAVVTTAAAVSWAQSSGQSRNWWAKRLSIVRSLATYLASSEPGHQIPPPGLIPARSHRAMPYLYSEQDIVRLMQSARALPAEWWALTVETAIGLLAVTGMRVGEVVRLDLRDIDWEQTVVTVRSSKFGLCRFPHNPNYVAFRIMLRRLRTVGPVRRRAQSPSRLNSAPYKRSRKVSSSSEAR